MFSRRGKVAPNRVGLLCLTLKKVAYPNRVDASKFLMPISKKVLSFPRKRLMESPLSHFSTLTDPRVDRTREHNLENILFYGYRLCYLQR
jgi:hypothetical protein